ncbi:MAG TPA: ATP-binding protein [Mobilitalea sp.]|nr:ATP-binding protein [Mobilitalea sp.]
MFRSIKTRLTVTICGVLLLVFSIQLAVNFLFAEKYYEFRKTLLLQDVYHQIMEEAKVSEGSISEIMSNVDFDNNLELIIFDQDKNVVYGNMPEFFRPDDKVGAPDKINDLVVMNYPESYYKESEPTILKSDNAPEGRITLLAKLEAGGSPYYLTIQIPIKSISREMKSTNIFILYISTFATIAGGLIVYFIAKQFAKPIEDINKVAINVSNLNFSTRAEESKRKDEIGSLASNINIMSDRLEENIVRLQEANRKLEYDNEVMNKVDEQRKELIANISHELKTPLAILGGYAEMLNNDIPGIDKTFYYETIQDETRKMDIMIQNLLNLSNMENKLANLSLEEVNIVELTEWIYRKNSVLMKNKEILCDFSSQPCGTVLADPLYLEEAINNYISNAIRYTEKGHWLKIRVEQKKDEAVISVYNEGIQINEAHLDKLWNSFYREDTSRTRTSQNNIGLGLYIVRSIMNAHHGKCGVLNKERGVEFWLSLKLKQN